jgi:hypothetical protein
MSESTLHVTPPQEAISMSKGAGGNVDATVGHVAHVAGMPGVGAALRHEGRAGHGYWPGPIRQTVVAAVRTLGDDVASASSSVESVVGRGRGCNGD